MRIFARFRLSCMVVACICLPCSVFAEEVDCTRKAQTAAFLTSKSLDPIPDDDCRVEVLKGLCEIIFKGMPYLNRDRQNLAWRDTLGTYSRKSKAEVCKHLDSSGNLPAEFELGDFDY